VKHKPKMLYKISVKQKPLKTSCNKILRHYSTSSKLSLAKENLEKITLPTHHRYHTTEKQPSLNYSTYHYFYFHYNYVYYPASANRRGVPIMSHHLACMKPAVISNKQHYVCSKNNLQEAPLCIALHPSCGMCNCRREDKTMSVSLVYML